MIDRSQRSSCDNNNRQLPMRNQIGARFNGAVFVLPERNKPTADAFDYHPFVAALEFLERLESAARPIGCCEEILLSGNQRRERPFQSNRTDQVIRQSEAADFAQEIGVFAPQLAVQKGATRRERFHRHAVGAK